MGTPKVLGKYVSLCLCVRPCCFGLGEQAGKVLNDRGAREGESHSGLRRSPRKNICVAFDKLSRGVSGVRL